MSIDSNSFWKVVVNVMPVYTVEEAAEKLRKGRTWTWAAVRRGELRSFKIGARRVVPEDALDEFIKRAMARGDGRKAAS